MKIYRRGNKYYDQEITASVAKILDNCWRETIEEIDTILEGTWEKVSGNVEDAYTSVRDKADEVMLHDDISGEEMHFIEKLMRRVSEGC